MIFFSKCNGKKEDKLTISLNSLIKRFLSGKNKTEQILVQLQLLIFFFFFYYLKRLLRLKLTFEQSGITSTDACY